MKWHLMKRFFVKKILEFICFLFREKESWIRQFTNNLTSLLKVQSYTWGLRCFMEFSAIQLVQDYIQVWNFQSHHVSSKCWQILSSDKQILRLLKVCFRVLSHFREQSKQVEFLFCLCRKLFKLFSIMKALWKFSLQKAQFWTIKILPF